MATARVGFAGNDEATRERIVELASSAGFSVTVFPSLDDWLVARCNQDHCCLVVDGRMPRPMRRPWMTCLARACGDLPVLVIVERGDIDIAVSALKGGAADILEVPAADRTLVDRIRSLSTPGWVSGA